MINKFMKKPEENKPNPALEKKPNENNGVVISSQIKIFDPNTKEVLVQKRAS